MAKTTLAGWLEGKTIRNGPQDSIEVSDGADFLMYVPRAEGNPQYEDILAAGLDPDAASDSLTLVDYRRAIQTHVDAAAAARNYDSGAACASYVASTVPAWVAEAQTFIAWRDQVWSHVFAELAKVEAGERAQPSVQEVVAELPTIHWPVQG